MQVLCMGLVSNFIHVFGRITGKYFYNKFIKKLMTVLIANVHK